MRGQVTIAVQAEVRCADVRGVEGVEVLVTVQRHAPRQAAVVQPQLTAAAAVESSS